MNIVIDASAAVSLVLALPGSEDFFAPLDEAELVMAPDLFVAEVCNAIWKYRKADLLSMDRCEKALDHALRLPDQLESSMGLHREAFALASRHIHPVYDALYLVLARRNNAAVLTIDRRLADLARKLEIEIVG
jgi:predicted nucleic acid-binding protein